MNEVKDVIPDWFVEAINAPRDDRTIDSAGCPIHYLGWGDPGRPRVLLIHGGGAHAHWWSFIAPMLADRHRVLALDLRGMGDSGHCPAYRPEDFARDCLAVCRDDGDDRNLIVVGHSFGGFVAVKTAVLFPDHLAGTMVVDTPFRSPDDPDAPDPDKSPVGPRKVYADFQEAVSRFRLLPEQPCRNRFLLDYCTRHALTRTSGGWTWKFDPEFWPRLEKERFAPLLPAVPRPIAVLYGEHSRLMSPAVLANMRSLLPPETPFVEVPDAHHHVMLDQPLALIDHIRRIADAWRA